RQTQIDTIDERLISTVGPAAKIHHAVIALVDVLRGEEEAVIVEPERSLQFTEIAGYVGQPAAAVRAGGSRVSCLRVDLVAPRKRRTPPVVIEGAGEMMHVGSAIAFRAVMGVVKVGLGFVDAKAFVGAAIERKIVVDPGEHRFAIASLDEG